MILIPLIVLSFFFCGKQAISCAEHELFNEFLMNVYTMVLLLILAIFLLKQDTPTCVLGY